MRAWAALPPCWAWRSTKRTGGRRSVDFLNPRRRIQVRRFGRVHALAAAAAGMLLLALGVRMWSQAAAPARELAEVQEEIRRLEPIVAQYDAVTAKADAIERWQATDVNWLDELVNISRELRPEPLASKEFPVAQDVVVKHTRAFNAAGQQTPGVGRWTWSAVASSASVVSALEGRLRDEAAPHAGGRRQARPQRGGLRLGVWTAGRRGAGRRRRRGGRAMTNREKSWRRPSWGCSYCSARARCWADIATWSTAASRNYYEAKHQLADAELALARGRLAVKKLEAWQDQSLPADRELAMSLISFVAVGRM